MKIVNLEKLKPFFDKLHDNRRFILSLSVLVVFITTYLLILPAFTLDKDKAVEQGGIDVPGVEETQETDAEDGSGDITENSDSDNEKGPDSNNVQSSPETGSLSYEGKKYNIEVVDESAVLPESTELKVEEIDEKKDAKEYKNYYEDALKAVQEEKGGDKVSGFSYAKFYDISLLDGKDKINPDETVSVKISYDEAVPVENQKNVKIVHFAEDPDTGKVTPEVLDSKAVDLSVENKEMTETTFEAESFSVYAVVYTVDFEYEVDGKIYKYNMPGGGYVSLSKLVEVLGVLDGAKHADAADFMAEVDHLEFSNPELVWVEKVDTETTVGNLKEQNGLHVEYSAELTNEQIEEINAQTLKAGDWALISMQPFDSAETLTVTMKDGDEFTIQLTDSQTTINSATVHYGYMVGNTFHEFNTEQFSPPTSGFGNPAYLIYDVPGYQYAGTTYYRSSANTNMSYASTVNPTINNYSSGHYYVTYEPRPTATQGGDSSTAEAYPEEPTVTKSSTENPNTGTNTISLEVEGKR
ncbi:MAG: hypothetical protein J6D57_12135, partial [Mogibacterium sp.]|nr:hypothetical protein [Mogibacterium sp.]